MEDIRRMEEETQKELEEVCMQILTLSHQNTITHHKIAVRAVLDQTYSLDWLSLFV